jgi:hypothetical protein
LANFPYNNLEQGDADNRDEPVIFRATVPCVRNELSCLQEPGIYLSSLAIMKRIITFLLIVTIVGVAASYLLIPGVMLISESSVIGAPISASSRVLREYRNWEKWWPASNEKEDSFYHRKFTFYPGNKADNKQQVFIKSGRLTLNSTFKMQPVGDSTETVWETKIIMGTDPLSRFRNYLNARAVRNSLHELSLSIKNYLERPANIYGFNIERTRLPSVHLVAVNEEFNHYPQASEIYAHINRIKNYIDTTNAQIAGEPVLNVTDIGSRQYQAMIGLPVDREIAVNGKLFTRRNVTTNVLSIKVKGGTATTRQALTALYNYLHDYKLVSPAIPFESLVTDRMNESDTSKWETNIYLPIL